MSKPGPKKLSSKNEYSDLIAKYDTFLFDCDGVLWSGDDPIPGAKAVLEKLRLQEKRVVFVTNNASKSRKAYKGKFDKLEIPVEESEIISSSYAAAAYLKDVLSFPLDRKVYVIGMAGIEEELDAVGIKHCGGTDLEDNRSLPAQDFSSLQGEKAIDPSVAAVMCGFDMGINYIKLAKAYKHLTREGAQGPVKANEKGGGCHMIFTNEDSSFPAAGGPWPGAGSLSAPLAYATKRKAVVIGKPNQPMLDAIKKIYHLDEAKTIFIGDRLDTDIAFANNGNIDSLLVLTGISTQSDCSKEDIYPTFITNSLGDLE